MITWCKAGCPLPGDKQAFDEKPVRIEYQGAANDSVSIPADCVGSLISLSGGAYLPWGPYLSADEVLCMRAELLTMIERLAALEGWAREHLDDVMTRAMRGPLSDLLPNLSHFRDRISALIAEQAACDALLRRSWRGDGLDDRRL
ncbi:hypothetical protein [Paraburkholderia aspalathi]|nr:hypothetical protein [Paraburkholderia aspalathi]MBK3821939.1 hypothetical protein [Paraburkholderia aspalathi]MBK3863534.1 hypothetical protein [Paraburkholderia aspalathi]